MEIELIRYEFVISGDEGGIFELHALNLLILVEGGDFKLMEWVCDEILRIDTSYLDWLLFYFEVDWGQLINW